MKKCVIIDDDQDDQEIFLMCLKAVSTHIDCAIFSSAVDALAKFRSDDDYIPDYIFLDVNMPKMNGIECLRILRNMRHLEHTEIYMYSTTSEAFSFAESKKLGANDFIIKPSKIQELKEKLSVIFETIS